MEIEMESHAMQNAPLGENSIQHKTQNRKAPIYVRGMLKKGNKKKITKNEGENKTALLSNHFVITSKIHIDQYVQQFIQNCGRPIVAA
jgi:hypothetical protein